MDAKNKISLFNIWAKKKKSGHFKAVKAKKIHEIFCNSEMLVANSVKYSVKAKETNATESENIISSVPSVEEYDWSSLFPAQTSTSTHNFQSNEGTDQNFEIVQSTESDDEGSSTKFDEEKFISELTCWAIKNRVNNVQLKGLLEIWNKNVPLPHLPKDPRTLLQTPRIMDIFENPNEKKEQYWYYGLQKSLLMNLKNVVNLPSILSLNFNIDGLPISTSSSDSFWPILYNIHEMKDIRPLVVSIFYGKSEFLIQIHTLVYIVLSIYCIKKLIVLPILEKPSSLELLLRRFVDELNHIIEYGMEINKQHINFKVRAFILDSPARSQVKSNHQ